MDNLLSNIINKYAINESELDYIFEQLAKRYDDYNDPWGFDLETCKTMVKVLYPFYRHYFRVQVHGMEKVENIPYIVTGNHTGQIPIDGMLVSLAFVLENRPPRVLRGMVERFLAGLPYLGKLAARGGSILGDRRNCNYLIDQGESILVFPEGVRGISKNSDQFYQLKNFGHGFYRIALKQKTPILPIAVVGAEEFYPYVYHFRPLAKLLGVPSLPLTPSLLLGGLPLPSPIDIYIGDPIPIPENISADAPEQDIRPYVVEVENVIRNLIDQGLRNKRNLLGDRPEIENKD